MNQSTETMILLLALSVIPGIVLIIQNGINLHFSSEILTERIMIKENIHLSMEVGRLIHSLQYERDVMSLYISSERDAEIYVELAKSYRRTDEALGALSKWKGTNLHRVEFGDKESYFSHLRHFRNGSDDHSLDTVVTFFSKDNLVFIDWMVSAVKEEKHSDIWADLVAYNMLVNGKESVGIERALGAYFFTNGGLDLDTLLWYKGTNEMALRYLGKFSEYSKYGRTLRERHIDMEVKVVVDGMRQELLLNSTGEYSLQRGLIWMDNMTSYINDLDVINREFEMYIESKTEEEIVEYRTDVIVDVVVLLLTLVIVPMLLFFIYKIAKKVEVIRKHLEEKTQNLEKEKQRTETLLSQLVPGKIARKMRSGHVTPEFFSHVTVMVSDICNFEMFLAKSTPSEIIDIVNTVFDIIERRISAYNVNKIGSIGNLLYVASGLNQDDNDYHVTNVADLALDMIDRVRQVRASHVFGESVKLVIGLNTGAVTAGVVNGTVPRYCLYGETVVTAKSMATSCLPGHIQVSETTYQQLKKTNCYNFKSRDDLSKLRGAEVQTKCYLLLGKSDTPVVQVDIDGEIADV